MSKSSLARPVGHCFAAGTLVHTKTGLVPIEQIKAGDWVLSRQELAGEQAYKQVVRTDSDLSGSIGLLSIYTKGENGRVGHLVVTSDHPFFVKDGGEYSTHTATGWVDAGELGIGNELALVDGGSAFVWGFWELRNTETPGVSWFTFDSTSDFGRHVDLRTAEVIVGEEVTEDYYALSAEGGFTRVQVYNLEVEDFHSYYIGAHGVWVHDVGKEQARAGFSRDTKVHLGDGDPFTMQMYGIEVEDSHSYFVDELGISVRTANLEGVAANE